MLKACIQVSLSTKKHYVLEMCMINMCIHSEQSFEYNLYNIHEILRERYSQSTWKYFLIIQLVLYPSH